MHHRTAIFIFTNMATKKQVENFNGIDEATDLIELGQPYTVSFTVQGTGKMLMHCWNISSIAEKAAAKKEQRNQENR